MEIEQSASINDKSDEEIAKENEYLPAHGAECDYEYRVYLDNMKDKFVSAGKHNNKDERLSRDLKGHNWLMNKLKVQFDPPEASSASEERSIAKAATKIRNRRHSMPVTSTNKHCEEEQESAMRSTRETPIEAIDYSVKKKQKTIPVGHIPSYRDDIIYDLRKYKKTTTNINDEEEPRNNSTQGSIMHTPENQTAHVIITKYDATNGLQGSVSDLRKIRRTDKQSASDQLKKLAYSVDKEKPRNSGNRTGVNEDVRDTVSIKHNLPLAVQPQREKPITIQNVASKIIGKMDAAVQTHEFYTFTEQDLELLSFIKLNGVTKDQISSLIGRKGAEVNNNNSVQQFEMISDDESDGESESVKNDILRKLLDQSEMNKSVINKTYDFFKKTDTNDGTITKTPMPNTFFTNADKSQEKMIILSKVIKSMISNLKSKKVTQTQKTQTIDNEMFEVKRKKVATRKRTENNKIPIDNGNSLKHKQHRFPLDEHRRGAIYLKNQRNIQTPYHKEQLAEINRSSHHIYNHKTIEAPQVSRIIQPRASPYTNRQIIYYDAPRFGGAEGNLSQNYDLVHNSPQYSDIQHDEPQYNNYQRMPPPTWHENNWPKTARYENNDYSSVIPQSAEPIISQDFF